VFQVEIKRKLSSLVKGQQLAAMNSEEVAGKAFLAVQHQRV
jgi:hypothetical protein